MCRLVAYSGPPLSLRTLVFDGEHSLHRQSWLPRELRTGSVNVDGYGVVWPGGRGGGLVRLGRVEPTWHDPGLPSLLDAHDASLALAAVRNATPGLPVGRAGLLPLVRSDWALAMNGYIPRFRERHMRALRAPLSDRRYAELQGCSDAETIFLRALQAMDEGATPAEALRSVRDAVAERMEDREVAPLTMVLLGEGGLTVVHTTIHGPVNSLYLGRGTSLAPDGVLLVSEPLTPADSWEPVPPDSLVEIRAAEASIRPLPGPGTPG